MAAGMAAMAESMNNSLIYDDGKPVPYRKSPLNNKQLKARKKAKLAKKLVESSVLKLFANVKCLCSCGIETTALSK